MPHISQNISFSEENAKEKFNATATLIVSYLFEREDLKELSNTNLL